MGEVEAAAGRVQHEVMFIIQNMHKETAKLCHVKKKKKTPPKLFIHNPPPPGSTPSDHSPAHPCPEHNVSAAHSAARHPWKRRCVKLGEATGEKG